MQIFKININTNQRISFERGKKNDSKTKPNTITSQIGYQAKAQLPQAGLPGYNYYNPGFIHFIHKKSTQENGLVIKKAKNDDLRTIHRIDLEAFDTTDPVSRSFEGFKQEIEGLDNYVIKSKDGKFIGYFQLEPIENGVLYINSIGVIKELRNTRASYEALGKMQEEIRKIALANGVEKVQLHVDAENKMLVKLYKKYGFEIKNTEADYFENGNAAYFMEIDTKKYLAQESAALKKNETTFGSKSQKSMNITLQEAELQTAKATVADSVKPATLTPEQYQAMRKELEDSLNADPNFPNDEIKWILQRTNEQNIWLAKQICADPNFPKDEIAYILYNTNEENISLAKQLCADPNFPNDRVRGILQRTNEQNISLAKQLCADPNFPKDEIADMLYNTNEKNVSAKLEMYTVLKNDPALSQGGIAGILTETNEKNISAKLEMYTVLGNDSNFPKDEIALVLQYTDEQSISAQVKIYNVLKNGPELSQGGIAGILYYITEQNISYVKQLLADNFHQEIITRRHILKSGTEDLTDAKIYAFIAKNANNLVAAKEILGDSAIIDSFGLKLEGMENLLAKCGILKRKLPPEQYEQLLQVFNPNKSKKGQRIAAIAQKLKEQNQELAKIPDLSIKKPKMDHRSKRLKNLKTKITELQAQIKGMRPNEKFTKLKVLAAIAENNVKDVPEFIGLLTANKQIWNSAVNKKIFEILELEFNQEVSSKLNLANSEYISEILSGNRTFKENFKSLVKVIVKHPDKTIREALDTLPQNIETKKVFDKLGLDYNKWVSVDKNSFERVVITTDSQKARQAAISSMEADFNDAAFHSLPKDETDKILKALKENNVTLKEVTEVIYDGAGFEQGTRNVLKLYYDDKPIEFAQLGKAIKTMKEVMNKEAFWSTAHSEDAVNQAKNTIYEHITKLRDNEVDIASRQKGETTTEIEVRKTDMNNISHSLFLGNHGACCTAVGTGFNQFSAPTYIKNKLISAIEVVDGKNFVGNTMCYIAEVDGKPSLVLDNIELNAQYQYNDAIRDAMFKYAQRLTTEIGAPDMPIYGGPHRHKVNMPASTLQERTVKILGSTADDEIYIDYQGRYTVNGNNTFKEKFYKIGN